MTYDRDDLKEWYAGAWQGDNFHLFKYVPQNRGLGPNEARRLVIDFKNDVGEAVELVINMVMRVIRQQEPTFRDQRACRYVVAIPRSGKGGARPGAERVCAALGQEFDWLVHLPGGLERLHDVKKSAWSLGPERPDYDAHKQSIRYAGPRLRPPPSGILLFDDVITRGETSAACRDVLIEATGAPRVSGLYLGRTV